LEVFDMKNLRRRILSVFLSLSVLLACVPAVRAAGDEFTVAKGVLTAYHGAGGDVTIPAGVTEIGAEAFAGCGALTSVTIPAGVVKIDDSAFSNCENLSSVSLPNGLRAIGKRAFNGCAALKAVSVPKGVSSLNSAFSDCTSLETVSLPEGVTDISYAFINCSSLKTIDIPNSVRQADFAFCDCAALTSAHLPDGVTQLWGTFSNCGALRSVNIPDSVISLAYGTFSDCVLLTSVTLPEGLHEIGDDVFLHDAGLTEIHIPHGVTYVGYRAFKGCKGLKSVTLPAHVQSLGEEAFWETSIRSIVMLNPIASIYAGPMVFPVGAAMYGYPSFGARDMARLGKLNFIPLSRDTVVEPGRFAATLDGKPVSLRTYVYTDAKGGSTNYIMLRDAAMLFSGTDSQFSVDWSAGDGIFIVTGQPYVPVGGELRSGVQDAKPYVKNAGSVRVNGETVPLTSFFIEGNNYFTLRDLGAALGFDVGWENGTVVLQSRQTDVSAD